eukprot:scaffold33271_cov62-Phaeocystis_antarctica.AAC.4
MVVAKWSHMLLAVSLAPTALAPVRRAWMSSGHPASSRNFVGLARRVVCARERGDRDCEGRNAAEFTSTKHVRSLCTTVHDVHYEHRMPEKVFGYSAFFPGCGREKKKKKSAP